MVEVCLIKLPSWHCLQIYVTGWNLLKINPTLVQVHLMTWCLCFTVVKSDGGCRPVGNQLAISWGAIGDWSATGWRLYLVCLFLIAESLQLFGDRSATDLRLKTVSGLSATAAIGGRPVGDLSATTKNLSTINLVAERLFHLQQPKPPCDQIVPATFCNRLPTSRRPPCNRPATSLRPSEILVARKSPTGCKLCVTGA